MSNKTNSSVVSITRLIQSISKW